MYTRKINYIWAINLVLLIAVVFLGIEQAGRGADISQLENQFEGVSVQKRELSENLFQSGSDQKLLENVDTLGFAKPSKVLYFNIIETVASR